MACGNYYLGSMPLQPLTISPILETSEKESIAIVINIQHIKYKSKVQELVSRAFYLGSSMPKPVFLRYSMESKSLL